MFIHHVLSGHSRRWYKHLQISLRSSSFGTTSVRVANKSKRESSNDILRDLNQENEILYGPVQNQRQSKTPTCTADSNARNITESRNRINPADVSNEFDQTVETKPKLGRTIAFPLVTFTKAEGDSDDAEHLSCLAKQVLAIEGQSSSVDVVKPSVTKVLQNTMSPESATILERWRQEMIAKLGVKGFAQYQQDLFKTGKTFHEEIMEFLMTRKESKPSASTEGYWASIINVLHEVSNVVFMEEKVSHSYLGYHGIADCVASYKDQQFLIEWKTSQKKKSSLKDTYDNSLQVAAYVGALNSQQKLELPLETGLIVIAYSDGQPAHVHAMSKAVSENAWNMWLTRLHQFYVFQNKRNESL